MARAGRARGDDRPSARYHRLCLATIVGLGLAIGGRILAPGDAEPLPGWTAISTHFGDLSEPFRDYVAEQFIQQKAAETSARVLIFPEFVVPRSEERRV